MLTKLDEAECGARAQAIQDFAAPSCPELCRRSVVERMR